MSTDHFSSGEYVPDPESDATAVIEGFFHHLSGDLVAKIRRRHEELIAADGDEVVDEPARHNLRMTLVLVAAYEILRPHLGHEATLEAVRAAFVEPLAPLVREGTRAMLDFAPDPYRAMVALAKTREVAAFGAGFTFRHPVDDDDRFHADIHRCFFHDVLAKHGVPELTPVLCAFDRNWIDAIDPAVHGFRFERETTIGTGGSHCPFHFSRIPRDAG